MSTASLCGWAEPGDIYQYGKWLACVCAFARRPLISFFFFFPRKLQTQEPVFEANVSFVDHKKGLRGGREEER